MTKLQETMDRLLLLMRAGYPVIYIVSPEETRVLDYLAKVYRVIKQDHPTKHFLIWDKADQLREMVELSAIDLNGSKPNWLKLDGLRNHSSAPQALNDEEAPVTLAAIAKAEDNFPELADSLTVFFDIHQYLVSGFAGNVVGSLVRPLRNAATACRRYYEDQWDIARECEGKYKTIFVVAPSASGLSAELERDLIVVDFPLPEEDELQMVLEEMILKRRLGYPQAVDEKEIETLLGKNDSANETPLGTGIAIKTIRHEDYESRLRELIAGAGRGLALEDYKQGLNMFAVTGMELSTERVEEMLHLKAKAINNQALQYTPHVEIDLGGLESVKTWLELRRGPALSQEVRNRFRLPSPKGVLLCGVSGGGKSQLAKLIAKEFNLALLRLDVGALFGQYVGESEERTRQALKLAEALAPVVLWLDEIDKAFRGVGGGGDNGVSARVFGHFLTWLAEKQDSVFVVATANDFTHLLNSFPEFGRKGRFDEIFWIDLPGPESKKGIFRIYLKKHYDDGYLRVDMEDLRALAKSVPGVTVPADGDPLELLCEILSHPTISRNMTGAEIEHAINEALYDAYDFSRNGGTFRPLDAGLVLNAVQGVMNRALYRNGSDDIKTLDTLRKSAAARNWISAT